MSSPVFSSVDFTNNILTLTGSGISMFPDYSNPIMLHAVPRTVSGLNPNLFRAQVRTINDTTIIAEFLYQDSMPTDIYDIKLEYSSFGFNSTATSTSTTTGAVTVTGGVGVRGSIYSADGNPLQNYLLYTPKVTVTGTGIPPSNPNVGDFWIDTIAAGQLQYIQDGASAFWIQITNI